MACEGNVCGTGGWGGPLPGDPDNSSTVLSATPAFGGIDIRWNYPATNPFAVAYVTIYRSINNDWNAATPLTKVVGEFYYDKVPPYIPYWYWIRITSINGTTGDPIGPATAAARPTIEGLIEELTGKIDAGVLAQALKTEIERIPGLDIKIFKEIDDRIAANVALADALAAVRADVGSSIALITQEVTKRTEGDNALVSSINTIAVGNNTNAAAIIEERNARVGTDDALAQRIDTLYAEIGTGGGINDRIQAAILEERTVTVDREAAIANTVTALSSKVTTDIGVVESAIQAEAQTRATKDTALTQTINTMGVKVGENTADIITVNQSSVDRDGVLAQYITTAQTALNGQIAAVQTNLQTNIDTTDGKVTEIGALYTAKVSVNGLIGGFGVYNDGTEVQAGFDVDTFWIGRTSADKRKPFIVVGQETFIDEAVINKLTFSKLRDESGAFIVENGKVKANYLAVDNLTAKNIDVNSGVSGQNHIKMNNDVIQVYDANNTLRVRMGVWA